MSQWQNVPKSEWRALFDRMSKTLQGKLAEVEVASLALGDQVVADWVPMIGMTYDSHDDLLDVALEHGSHVIPHPREIAIEEGEAGLSGVAIVDGDGARQVVRLKEPVKLPNRSAGSATA